MAVAKGSTVEVSSNEPGFHGAWYVATLIDELKPNKPSKEIRYLVKYDTLLTDDDTNEPLTEIVEPSWVRPLPPRNLRRNNVKNTAVVAAEGGGSGGGGADFEMYDVVDAYHREGWWIGVVSKVVSGGGGVRKYVVSFENPPEDVEFGRGQLRLHVDWVHGRWRVQPKKIPEHVFASRNAKRAPGSNNDARSGLATTDVDNPTVDLLLSSSKKSKKKNTEGNSEMAGAVEASDPFKRNKSVTNTVEQDSGEKRFQSSTGMNRRNKMHLSKAKVYAMEKHGSDGNNKDSALVEHEDITAETCDAKDDKSSKKKERERQPKVPAKGPINLLGGTELHF